MKNTLLMLLLCGSVAGCASNQGADLGSEVQQPVDFESCCSGFSEFNWTQLNKTESFEFLIDNSSPVWRFSEGKSYFAAFEFSPQSKTVELAIHSNMLNKTVLAPTVLTLDSNFNVVDEYKPSSFDIRYSDALKPNRYQASYKLDAEKTPYFVIYASQNEIGNEIVIPHPAKVRAINSGDPLPIVTDLKYVTSYEGEFAIEVETLSLSGKARSSQKKPVAKAAEPVVSKVQTDTVNYYNSAIRKAVKEQDIPKALALLEEAKALGISDAQATFVDAVNNR